MTPEKHPLDTFLQDVMSHSRLDEEDRSAILNLPFRLRRLDIGSYLVREGSEPTHCAVLVDGFAYRQKMTGNGARQILAVCIPGDAVDLQNIFLDISDHAVQTLTRTTIADLSRDQLQNLVLTRPAIGRAIIQLTLVEASILREWVVNVGRRDAKTRIAHLLCELAARLTAAGGDRETIVDFPMTQEQVADATGLTAVHTNRTLQHLRKAGLISLSSNRLTILDWDALTEAGDFNERYLHHAV